MERHWMMLSFTANRHNFTVAGLAVNSVASGLRSAQNQETAPAELQ